MTTLFFTIFNQFRSWFLGAGAVALALLGVYAKGRSDGKSKAVEADRKELDKHVQIKREIDQDVSNDSDDDLDKRLRNWVKD